MTVRVLAYITMAIGMAAVATHADDDIDRRAAEQVEERGTPRDAAKLYLEAFGQIGTDSPAATALEYPEAPPFGAEWDKVAALSWETNQGVFPIARRARAINDAVWPKDPRFYNRCRHLTNIVGDAAMYQHLRGEDRAAVELIRDLDHFARLLRANAKNEDMMRFLVGTGIDTLAMYRLAIIASEIRLTADPGADPKAFPVAEAAALVEELLANEPADVALRDVIAPILELKREAPALAEDSTADRLIEQYNRTAAQRVTTAMALACHLFRHGHGRWPANLDELAEVLPADVPIDPWGDGKQTYGYVLVKNGLPDKSDRPLVYSRCNAQDGLAYRTDGPQYGFYSGDGSDRPYRITKRGGQFRDVARWQGPWPPVRGPMPQTRPLEDAGAPGDGNGVTPRPAP